MRLLLLLIFSLTVGNTAKIFASQDSTLFLLGSFLGGKGQDRISGIARDAKGDIFIVGTTESADFPITIGPKHFGDKDVFLAKLSSEGTLLFSTLLGGTALDEARSITIDALGFPIIAGVTYSPDFPATSIFSRGPTSAVYNGGVAFVARYSPDGMQMLFADLLGGDSKDEANDVVASPDGVIWVTGTTESIDFPITPFARQQNFGGKSDGFLAELHPTGDLLAYSTYIGGSANDNISAIALDAIGNIYCGGSTNSPDFPGAPAPARSSRDLFVAQYIGGTMTGFTNIFSIQGDNILSDMVFSPVNGGRIYCAGSASWNSLVGIRRGGYRELTAGKTDAFIIGMTSTGGLVESATFFGGSADDLCTSIAIDGSDVIIAGTTSSDAIAVTPDAFARNIHGGRDCFVASFDAELQNLKYCSFAGGSANDEAAAVASFRGTICLAGLTASPDFPIVLGDFSTEYGGGESDGFVQIFNPVPLFSITPSPVRFDVTELGESKTIDTLIVRNISQLRATRVDSVILENDAFGTFILDKFGFFPTFPPGASGRLRITFTPRIEGEAAGVLAIWANGVRYAVDLLGKGTSPPPQFTADNVIFDTIEVNAQSIDSIRIANSSNHIFTVDSVRAEGTVAGCFVVLDKTPFDVLPLGERFLKVMFFPSEQGKFVQLFRIFARSISVPVQLEGFAKSGMPPPVDSVSIADTDFGDIAILSTEKRTIAIKNAVSRTIILDSIAVEFDAETTFSITSPAPPWVILPGDSLALIVSALPKTLGKKNTEIAVYLGRRRFSCNISANGTQPPSPKISVKDVDFRNVIVNQFYIDSTWIKNSGSAAADIIEASITDDKDGEFYVYDLIPRSLAVDDSMPVRLKFAPVSSGKKSSKLIIKTSAGIYSAILSGIALPPDSAVIDIVNLAFQPTFIGTYRDSSITLFSAGHVAARIDSVGMDSAAFTLGADIQFPIFIAPGNYATLPIRFAPQNATIYSAKFTVWHKDGIARGMISGEGILPPDTLFIPHVSLSLPVRSAAIGEIADFPLIISGNRRSLDSLHGKQFVAHIRFNANILAPLDGRGKIDGAKHTITLSGIVEDDILGVFRGVATLGDADSTALQLLDCSFTSAEEIPIRAEISLADGLLRITDIWKYGGPRLVESIVPEPVIVIRPNPINEKADILLYRVQPGCILQIFDEIGCEVIQFLPDVDSQTGEATVSFISKLARGIYMCRVISGSQVATKALFTE